VWHIGRREIHIAFWLGNLKEEAHFGELVANGRILKNCSFRNIILGSDRDELALESAQLVGSFEHAN
jgi:hypothetical protein